MQLKNLSLFFMLFGFSWMLYAIRGIVRKEITTYPRGRTGSTYVGEDAVRRGFLELIFGFTFAAVGFTLFWFA